MSNLSIEELANLAAQTEDHTETKAGGDFEYVPPPAGPTLMRLVEYIELGMQKQKPFQGKPKADAEMVRLTFELLSPQHISEIEVEGGKKKIANRISITLNKNFGEKAKFKKLFNKMVYGRDKVKHYAQMLGEAFMGVVHQVKDEKTKKVYSNLRDAEGNWTIGAPRVLQGADPLSGIEGTWVDVSSKVHPAISPLRIFLWDHPNKETWDSLHIDGTRTVKNEDGTEREESKNWLQEMIRGASNFAGSALAQLITGVEDSDLPVKEEQVKQNPTEASTQTSTATSAQTTTTSPSEVALQELEQSKPAETSDADALAALGL